LGEEGTGGRYGKKKHPKKKRGYHLFSKGGSFLKKPNAGGEEENLNQEEGVPHTLS